MSVIVKTTDERYSVLPLRLLSRWQVFLSATEACGEEEVFPLPLDYEDYEKWLDLAIRIDSRAIHDEGYLVLDECHTPPLQLSSTIIPLMDPLDETWQLHCETNDDRVSYVNLGKLVVKYNIKIPFYDPQYLQPSILLDRESLFIGILYCDMLQHGCRHFSVPIRSGYYIDIDKVSWAKMLQYDVSQLFYDRQMNVEDQINRASGLAVVFSDHGDYPDKYPYLAFSADFIWDYYTNADVYPYLIRYLCSVLDLSLDWRTGTRRSPMLMHELHRNLAEWVGKDLASIHAMLPNRVATLYRCLAILEMARQGDRDSQRVVRDNITQLRELQSKLIHWSHEKWDIDEYLTWM